MSLLQAQSVPVVADAIAADLVRMDAFARPQASVPNLASDPELVNDFIVESSEYLAAVEQNLLAIEKNGADTEAVHTLFRAFHTIKGLAGFLEFQPIQEVAHEIENSLDLVRSGAATLTPSAIDTVLRAADYLKLCLETLARTTYPAVFPPYQELLERIRRREPEPVAASPVCAKSPSQSQGAGTAPTTVKVDTAKLDALVDMIGELVLAQSVVRHDPALNHALQPGLARNLAQLVRVTGEIQKTAMSMRMVPIGQLFARMERVVRDLARKSGKSIAFEMTGESAELDRAMVEELADPLIHMIRNSVDHGLEPAAERTLLCKPACGTISLSAQHQAGCILIHVADNGRGLNKQRILEKARSKGLIGDDARLTDEEIYRLIFHPGFSTAERVTEISGRGVGMDVVSRHIQKLRGRIEIQSVEGAGCTFTFRLPLTLATIDGLVIGSGEERFIVPIFAIREILCSPEETRFTVNGSREMALVRGMLLPVVRLRESFGIAADGQAANILIVVQSRDREYCLAVDCLIAKQEVVIKNLGTCFRNTDGVAGGAILGDGRVALILDVDRLAGAPYE